MTVRLNGVVADAPDPFAIYRAIISDIFDAQRHSDSEGCFHADVQACAVDEMFLHAGRHSSAIYDRSVTRLRKDGLDDAAVLAVCEGSYAAVIGDREITVEAGDLLLIDRARPLRLLSQDNVQATLNMPRESMIDLLGPQEFHGRKIAGADARMVADVMLAVGRSRSSGRHVREALGLLLEQALLSPRDQDLRADKALSADPVSLRAIRYIDDNLSDPNLDAQHICHAIGTSRSRLYSAFAGEGVREHIRKRRLAKARSMLLYRPQLRIGQVAYSCGFSTASGFSTAFRNAFGYTPSQFVRSPSERECDDGLLDAEIRMSRWLRVLGKPGVGKVPLDKG